jgi:hypothetical protein
MSLEIHAVSCPVSCTVSGDGGHLSAEPDGRAWGYNGGKTQFFDGDSCYIIVYKSANTTIKGSACSPGGNFGPYQGGTTNVGLNIHREGLTFNSPVASVQKPIADSSKYTVLHSEYKNCSGLIHMEGTLNFRLKTWIPTTDPAKTPPYGFAFIEYTPLAQMWYFYGLFADVALLTTEVHGSIYGIVEAEPAL